MSEAELLEAVMALPNRTRADLVLRLVESLEEGGSEELSPEDWDASALAEARRRWSALKRGEAGTRPVRDAIESLKRKL